MKKTLAILLALAMVFSTLTVAFAEGSIGADAQACVTLNMLQGEGNGVTADYLAKTPTRLQAAIMVLRLKGLEDEALAYTGTDNFADVDQVKWAGGKAIMGYLKTHPEIGYVGDQGKFDPNGVMTAQAYYKVMLESLGYKQNTAEVIGDFTYAGVFEFAAKAGLSKVATVTNFTNNDVAIATIEALKATVKGGTKTLAVSLVDAGVLTATAAEQAGVYIVAPVTLAVESVSVLNAAQFQVVFNKTVDKDIAENEAMYKLGTTTLGATDKAVLQEDGKTVVVTLAAANVPANNSKKDITVSKSIKDTDGNLLGTSYVAKQVLFSDTTLPTLVKAEVSAPNKVKLIFSEPVDWTQIVAYSDFVVDNGSVAVTAADETTLRHENTIELTLGTNLTEGSHSVKVKDHVVDFANYSLLLNSTLSFDYAKDSAAPVATIKSVTETSVKFQFDEPVVNAKDANVAYRHTYNSSTYEILGTDPRVSVSADAKTVTVDFSAMPIAPGNNNVYISYKSSTGKKIQDNFGNKMDAVVLPIAVVADNTAPTVVSITAVDANTIEITYSEDVTGALTKSNYSIKDAGDNSISISSIDLKANTTATYVLTTGDLKGGNYTITVKNLKDKSVAKNVIADYSTVLAVTDSYSPYVSSAVAGVDANRGGKYNLVITFSEAMNADDLAKLANYRLYDTSAAKEIALTSTNASLEVVDDKTVKILLEITDVVPTSDKIVVSGTMKDLTDNTIGGFANAYILSNDTMALRDLNTLTVPVESIKLTAENKLYVEVDRLLDAVDVNLIKVNLQNIYGKTSNAGIYNLGLVSLTKDTAKGKTKIEFSLPSGQIFGTDGSAFANAAGIGNAAIRFEAGAFTSILGTSNAEIKYTVAQLGTALLDKVAPYMLSATTAAPVGGEDGTVGQVVVVFSENLLASSVAYDKFAVDGYSVDSSFVSGDTVTLTVSEDTATGTDTTPDVTLVGDIADVASNVLTHSADTVVTADDMTAPAVVSVDVANGQGVAADEITIVLSEAVYTNAAGTTALTKAGAVFEFDADGVAGGTVPFVIDSISEDGKTLTGHAVDVAADKAGRVRAVSSTALYDAQGLAMTQAWVVDGQD